MSFEEEDFIEDQKIEQEPIKEETEEPPRLYQTPLEKPKEYTFPEYGAYEKKEEKKVFRPSPIISPIYGVLDQNYKKEDIVTKKEIRITSSYENTRLDFDAVREKAYGDLSNEIGLSMNEEEKQSEFESSNEEDNLLFDMSEENSTPTVERVTVGDAEEYFQDLGLEYNIDYKDASKEKATGRRTTRVKEEVSLDDEEEKEEIKQEEKPLEDNLFDLIDSMYNEER